jgi:hypothetical protein
MIKKGFNAPLMVILLILFVIGLNCLPDFQPAQAEASRAGSSAPVQGDEKEPIAYVGHGGLFDQSGKQITVTLEFVAKAQDWYRNKLVSRLPTDRKAAFDQFRKNFNDLVKLSSPTQDEQTRLVVQQYSLDWLIANSNVDVRTAGKLKALKSALRWKLPRRDNVKDFKFGQEFKLNPDIQNKISSPELGLHRMSRLFAATTNLGQAYIDECRAADVPIPPPIGQLDPTGLTGWKSQGFIPTNQQFIVGTPAEVRTFQSFSPVGLCVALPRYADDALTTVALDGVICMGQTSSKVCFWDNQMSGNAFEFDSGTRIPIGVPDLSINPDGLYQAGGFELLGGSGGVCTDCHAGQNPYNIHPMADLNPIGGGPLMGDLNAPPLSLPTFSVARYDPLVAAAWPQNQLSQTQPYVPASCSGCHRASGSGGAFPHLSPDIPGYCGVLRTAVGALPLPALSDQPNPLPTMPLGAPGSLVCTPNLPNTDPRFRACTAAMTASCSPGLPATSTDPLLLKCTPALNTFLDWCNVPATSGPADRGDPHLTTTNGIDYDFQAAGEFRALRNSSTGFELQTRQSPIQTSFTPGANAYTGLASCVSLNTAVAVRLGKHRVTYQPRGGALTSGEQLELRVDGQLITLSGGGINLGNGNLITRADAEGGLNIIASDGTHIIVTPNFWASEGYWYLNVEVLNSPAREGTMGHIVARDWLPLGPTGSSFGPAPATLLDRHNLLNIRFADAWRVTNTTSLFDYMAGTSTADFTNRNWPPKPGDPCRLAGSIRPPVQGMRAETARELCSVIKDKKIFESCVLDLTATGEAGFVRAYLRSLKLRDGAITGIP